MKQIDYWRKGHVPGLTNEKNFLKNMALMNEHAGDDEVPNIALIMSDPGYGKTMSVGRYVAQRRGVHIRVKTAMTVSWLFRDIVNEIGEEKPQSTTERLFRQVVRLMSDPEIAGPLFLDDVDGVITSRKVTETIRDLADELTVPVILIGNATTHSDLKRYQRLRDRLLITQAFAPLTPEDIRTYLDYKLIGRTITDDAVDFLSKSRRVGGKIRLLSTTMLPMAERAAVNGVKEINTQFIVDAIGGN